MENVIFIKVQHTRRLDVGRFGICMSKAGDTHGMKYSLALQKTKAVEEKTPASLCPLSWNSEKMWLSQKLEIKWVICLTSPNEEEIFERSGGWCYKVFLSGSSGCETLWMRNSVSMNIPSHPLQKTQHYPSPLTQSKIASADKRQQKIRECFSLI